MYKVESACCVQIATQLRSNCHSVALTSTKALLGNTWIHFFSLPHLRLIKEHHGLDILVLGCRIRLNVNHGEDNKKIWKRNGKLWRAMIVWVLKGDGILRIFSLHTFYCDSFSFDFIQRTKALTYLLCEFHSNSLLHSKQQCLLISDLTCNFNSVIFLFLTNKAILSQFV